MKSYANIDNLVLISVKYFQDLQVDVIYYAIFEMNDFSVTS